MADILDAAQSNTPPPTGGPSAGGPPSSATPMEPPPPPAGGPAEPAAPPAPPSVSTDSLIIPPPEPQPTEPTTTSVPANEPPPEKPKKKSRLGVLLAGLLLLVITIPVLTIFVRQQVEIRSRATEDIYPTCISPNTCVSSNVECRDAGGTQVSKTCANAAWTCCNIPTTTSTCIFDNRVDRCVGTQWCVGVPIGEMGWIDNNCSVTKCNDNNNPYYCTTPVGNNVSTCIRNGECTPVGMSPTSCNVDARCGGRNTPNPTPTPTPTPSQCINIIAYKDGNALSQAELNALSPGNTITLAFAPGGAATKVRFRVNSGTWSQTTTKNANGQFIWNYTLENVTNFVIEAQWFDGSVWH